MTQASVTIMVGWLCICSSGLVTAVSGYFICDFNNETDKYCGWSNVLGNEKSWTWHAGSDTAEGITRLKNGHNYDGGEGLSGYLYLSDSTNGIATIRSGNITYVEPSCLVFWHYMFSTNPLAKGELKVDITGGTSLRLISDKNDTWRCETVGVNHGAPYTLEFVANIIEDHRMAIAIDDVDMLDRACRVTDCDSSDPTTEPITTGTPNNTSPPSLAPTDVHTTQNPTVQPTTATTTLAPVTDLLPIVLAVIAAVLLMTVLIVVIIWYFRWRKKRPQPIVHRHPIGDITQDEDDDVEGVYASIDDAIIPDIVPKQDDVRHKSGGQSAGEYVGLPPTANGVAQRDSDMKDEYDYIDGDVPRKNDDYLQPSGNTRPASDGANAYLQLSEDTRPVSNINDDYLQPSGDMRPLSDVSGDYVPMTGVMGPFSESNDDYVQPSGNMRPVSPASYGGDYLSASGHMVPLSDYDMPRRMYNDSTDEGFEFITPTRQQYPGGYDFRQSALDSVELPAAGDLGVAYTPHPYTG